MTKKSLLLGIALSAVAGLAQSAETGQMVPASQLEWREISPGSPVKITVLWGDRAKGEYAMLLKLPAGHVAPVHAHTGAYHGVNLTGTWRQAFDVGDQQDLQPGSYVFQPGLGMHGDACIGPEDCIVLIHQHAKADFIPKQ